MPVAGADQVREGPVLEWTCKAVLNWQIVSEGGQAGARVLNIIFASKNNFFWNCRMVFVRVGLIV